MSESLTLGLIPDTELAYIAGLIDGEGYLGIRVAHRPNGRYCVSLSIIVTNQHTPTLKWAQSVIGGQIYKHKGTPNYCYSLSIRHHSHIKWILLVLRPYLRIKSEETTLMLDACEHLLPRGGTHKGIERKGKALLRPDSYFQYFMDLESKMRGIRASKQEAS